MAWVALLATVTACEQSTQPLPFEIEGSSTRSISAEGGTVSSPAGASLTFPEGAVTGPMTVTVAPVATPTQAPGTTASSAFSIEPSGTVLEQPGLLEVRLAQPYNPESAWLSSIVGVRGGVVDEYSAGRIDLSTGILTTDIDRFSTFVAVTPPQSAVFPVESAAGGSLSIAPDVTGFFGVTVDSVTVDCGGPANRCEGVSATSTQNLLDLVDEAALIYPELTGALRIGSLTVTGSIRARATLRILLESGQTAESIEVDALLEPTAQTVAMQTENEIRLTNVRHRVSGGASGSGQAVDEIAALIIPRSGPTGTATVQRSFEIKVAGGATETATVSFTFPVMVFE